jgi:cytoskeleton protein RodZ
MMEDNLNEVVGSEEQSPSLRVGALLRAGREAHGLSLEEIAERIKFTVRQVEALEQDDVEHLPQGTFLRGFVRSYARVLGMDENKLLEATRTHTEHHFDVMDVQAGGAPLPVSGASRRRSRNLMLVALVVAVLLAGFIWLNPERDTPVAVQEPQAGPAEATVPLAGAVQAQSAEQGAGEPVKRAEEEMQEPAAVADKHEAPKPETVVKPVVVRKEDVRGGGTVVDKPATGATVQPADGSTGAADKPAVSLANLMKRPIHIVYLDDTWMEIIDVNGEILFSRVTKAGEEKWVGGGHRAPYKITIARPGAIRMYYYGKEVDLSKYNPANVAKLVLE